MWIADPRDKGEDEELRWNFAENVKKEIQTISNVEFEESVSGHTISEQHEIHHRFIVRNSRTVERQRFSNAVSKLKIRADLRRNYTIFLTIVKRLISVVFKLPIITLSNTRTIDIRRKSVSF